LYCVGIIPESEKPKGNYLPRERVFDAKGNSRAVSTVGSQHPMYAVSRNRGSGKQAEFREDAYNSLTSVKSDSMVAIPSSNGNVHAILEDMRIRRLTPTECERLMGLEDGWTAKGFIDGEEVEISDTQRYKMCGNGVVVNSVDYIYSLLKEEE